MKSIRSVLFKSFSFSTKSTTFLSCFSVARSRNSENHVAVAHNDPDTPIITLPLPLPLPHTTAIAELVFTTYVSPDLKSEANEKIVEPSSSDIEIEEVLPDSDKNILPQIESEIEPETRSNTSNSSREVETQTEIPPQENEEERGEIQSREAKSPTQIPTEIQSREAITQTEIAPQENEKKSTEIPTQPQEEIKSEQPARGEQTTQAKQGRVTNNQIEAKIFEQDQEIPVMGFLSPLLGNASPTNSISSLHFATHNENLSTTSLSDNFIPYSTIELTNAFSRKLPSADELTDDDSAHSLISYCSIDNANPQSILNTPIVLTNIFTNPSPDADNAIEAHCKTIERYSVFQEEDILEFCRSMDLIKMDLQDAIYEVVNGDINLSTSNNTSRSDNSRPSNSPSPNSLTSNSRKQPRVLSIMPVDKNKLAVGTTIGDNLLIC